MKLEDLKNKEFEITSDGLLKVVEKKIEKFIPTVGEEYWFIDESGYHNYYIYNNDQIDRWIINHHLVFRTREKADEYKHYLELLDKYKYNFSDEEWKNENIKKWHLYCHVGSGELKEYFGLILKSPNCVYFRTQEDAEDFIEEAGKDNIKKFMFDIWE